MYIRGHYSKFINKQHKRAQNGVINSGDDFIDKGSYFKLHCLLGIVKGVTIFTFPVNYRSTKT